MKKIKILLWAINESKTKMENLCKRALESANIFDVPAELFGVGVPFRGHVHRIELMVQELRWWDPEEILIFMDGADTLVNLNVENIIQRYLSFETEIVLSVEKNFSHQYFHFKDRYDTLKSSYRYVNAGTFMGRAGSLLQMSKELLEILTTYPQANDQGILGIWAYRHFFEPDKVMFDIDCKLFWVTTTDHQMINEKVLFQKFILHPEKKIRPAICHVPGIKSSYIEDVYEGLYSILDNAKLFHQNRIFILIPISSQYYGKDPHSTCTQELEMPSWFCERNPYVEVFYYGISDIFEGPNIIQSNYIREVIKLLEQKYYFDFLVHVPPDKNIVIQSLIDYLGKSDFSTSESFESPVSESFIYQKNRFYPNPLVYDFSPVSFEDRWNLSLQNHKVAQNQRLATLFNSSGGIRIEPISLGGWCGPAVAIRHFSIEKAIYPFDMINSTIDSVLRFVKGVSFFDFIPGEDIVTPHHNLTDPKIRNSFVEKESRFRERVKDLTPILWIRSIISNNYQEELNHLAELKQYLELIDRKDDRVLILLHDQDTHNALFGFYGYDIMIWSVQGQMGWEEPNRVHIYRNIEKIIEYALMPANWNTNQPMVKKVEVRNHHNQDLCSSLYTLNNEKK